MSDRKVEHLDRRDFVKWLWGGLVVGGAIALGLEACGQTPTVSERETPQPRPTPETWRWRIRWIAGPVVADATTWRLRIDGLVEQPVELSLEDLRAMSAITQRSRMKCVECWSAPAEWVGVAGRDVLALVTPLPGADYVTVHALDGYSSTLSLPELVADRALFVYGMDDQDLPLDHGAPLRLISPPHYGYKNVKAVGRLEFVDEHHQGYWERRGYDNVGIIRPGRDHPLDLGDTREIGYGEIKDY